MKHTKVTDKYIQAHRTTKDKSGQLGICIPTNGHCIDIEFLGCESSAGAFVLFGAGRYLRYDTIGVLLSE